MGIRIISKRDGYRRLGMVHSAEPQVYPDDEFTAPEIEILKEDPVLIITPVPDEEAEKTTDDSPAGNIDFDVITKGEIIELLGVKIKITPAVKKMTKAELIELYKDVEEEKEHQE